MAQKRKASISQRVQEVFKKVSEQTVLALEPSLSFQVQRRRSPRTKPSESSVADEQSPSPALSNIERFKAVFPQILDDVQSACEKYSLDIEVWQSLEKVRRHTACLYTLSSFMSSSPSTTMRPAANIIAACPCSTLPRCY
jgi:hypothetical protein